jgi:hypothetical protein
MTSLAAGALFTTAVLGNTLLQRRNSFQEKSSKEIADTIKSQIQQEKFRNSKPRKVVTFQDTNEMLELQIQRNRERKEGSNFQNLNRRFEEQYLHKKKTFNNISPNYNSSLLQGQKSQQHMPENIQNYSWCDSITNKLYQIEQNIENLTNALRNESVQNLSDHNSEEYDDEIYSEESSADYDSEEADAEEINAWSDYLTNRRQAIEEEYFEEYDTDYNLDESSDSYADYDSDDYRRRNVQSRQKFYNLNCEESDDEIYSEESSDDYNFDDERAKSIPSKQTLSDTNSEESDPEEINAWLACLTKTRQAIEAEEQEEEEPKNQIYLRDLNYKLKQIKEVNSSLSDKLKHIDKKQQKVNSSLSDILNKISEMRQDYASQIQFFWAMYNAKKAGEEDNF